VVANWNDAVVIRFDEVIDEMASGGGSSSRGGGLARQVILSPVAGEVRVAWRRSAITVEPREGWKRGRVYRLEVLPGIVDLRRNRLDTRRTVIFSTGPAIPTATLAGTALHWTDQRPLRAALIQAALLPDTAPYVTVADSAGDFTLAGIPPGQYVVYAVQDQNTNRRRDAREAYDSTVVHVEAAAEAVLWAFVHDTAGPRLRAAEPLDSVTFRLEFSQHLDPAARVDTAHVRVFTQTDTTPVRVAAVLRPAEYDSIRASAAAAARDTAQRRAPPVVGAPPGRAEREPDTSRARQLLSRRPAPFDRLVVRTAEPLKPEGRYLIRVTGVRNLNGAVGEGQQVLEIPKAPAPRPPPSRPPP
jgi:hypothetical protein